MDVEHLLNWHIAKAKTIKGRKHVDLMDPETREAYQFHIDAAKMVSFLSPNYRAARMAEAEIEAKSRAIQSLEKLAKNLLAEAKDMKQMYREVPPALLNSSSAPKIVAENRALFFKEDSDDSCE